MPGAMALGDPFGVLGFDLRPPLESPDGSDLSFFPVSFPLSIFFKSPPETRNEP